MQSLGPVAATVECLGELVDVGSGSAEDDRLPGLLDIEDAARAPRICAHGRRCTRSGGPAAHRPGRACPSPTLMVVGLFRCCLTMCLMRGGIVALKSTVWRVAGVSSRIVSMSSANPMSSISSASSRTTTSKLAEIERPAREVVDRPARRGDHDVDAALQRFHLADDRGAAVDRQDAGAEVAAVLVDRLGDLHGQLSGGDEHERSRARARRA